MRISDWSSDVCSSDLVLHLSIQPLLVRGDGRVLLFDTGAGDVEWARGGRLPASLRAAGVEPSQVTDVFISQLHADHVGGLLTPDGALAFPDATVHLSAPEWRSAEPTSELQSLMRTSYAVICLKTK